MTRELEELLEEVHNMNSYDTYSRLFEEISSLEQQLADMQKRIDELEAPKSCDGCMYLTQYGCNVCAICERHEKCIDRYEPKG